jgi:HlyD family secretion protein
MSVELARVRAPCHGRIIEIVGRVGEMTGLRPILRLADTDHMQVVAEVYETDIRRVQVGQEVKVTAEVLAGQSLHGRVVEIGTVIGSNEVQALGMAPTAEERIIKVWIDLDDSTLAATLINLQVDVEFFPIDASQGRAIP